MTLRTATRVPLPIRRGHASTLWRLVQWATVVGLVILPPLLFILPEVALVRFWSGVVPLLPVIFLLNPAIWRNVCPLASLSIRSHGHGDQERAEPGTGGWLKEAGILLLVLLIPLRPAGLEASATASAALVGLLCLGALLARRSPRKAGFCNGWCPVLPVERLYGQAPLMKVANVRCPECTVCTGTGCVDLSSRAEQAQLLGPSRRTPDWLLKPWGIFAAAFPGVVATFFLLDRLPSLGSGGVLTAATAYGWIAAGGFLSWGFVTLVIQLTGLNWRATTLALGGVSAAVYLWFALPGAATVWGIEGLEIPLRAAALVLVAAWLRTGFVTLRPRAA